MLATWLLACSGPPVETVDTDVNTGRETDLVEEVHDVPLGASCDPGHDLCAPGTLCCTACCLSDEKPVCTEDPGDGRCPLPNVSVDAGRLSDSIDIEDQDFPEDSCVVQEGCVGGTGWRRLLKFATTTPNDGTSDLHFGRPRRSDEFEWSACHEHYHFNGYAEYTLVDGEGNVVAAGHKQAFCLEDFEPWSLGVGSGSYTCENQGITRGWADTYDSYLDCQWIDITDVPPGDYQIRVELDLLDRIPELDETDNVQVVPVHIPSREEHGPVTDPCETYGYGEYRDCDWNLKATYECDPGTPITYACGDTCASVTCSGDPMMRLCDGASAEGCFAMDALALSDDDEACFSQCPAATGTCPASGLVSVYVGAWASYDFASCRVVPR